MDDNMSRMKLEALGRRVIEAKIYNRRHAARNRRILDIVHRHLGASASELQKRLTEAYNSDMTKDNDITAEVDAEIAKFR